MTPSDLTPRQREVAALVAEGLTEAEIGERLTISERTARQHIAAIAVRLPSDRHKPKRRVYHWMRAA